MNPAELPEPSIDLAALARSVALMAHLRGPEGCAWDREQTFDSLKRHTLEETYEVFDAIDRRAWPELQDELGDLLLQVLFYAQIAADAGLFTLADVAAGLNRKLIRRHPHLFGDGLDAESNLTSSDVKLQWERVKQAERQARGETPARLMDGVPRHLPALQEAGKLGAAAAKTGFDWPSADGLFAKLEEEAAELRAELRPGEPASARAAEELGDLLFTAVNLARHLHLEPEFALRGSNARFRERFNAMEAQAGSAEALRQAGAQQMELWWEEAKTQQFKTRREQPPAPFEGRPAAG